MTIGAPLNGTCCLFNNIFDILDIFSEKYLFLAISAVLMLIAIVLKFDVKSGWMIVAKVYPL